MTRRTGPRAVRDAGDGVPAAGGTYLLWLRPRTTPAKVTVGRLGRMVVRDGWYGYVGSALGPGGLRARIAHHLEPPSDPHWHLDYLRDACEPRVAWILPGHTRREHAWAEAVRRRRRAQVPLPGFGASDCRCPAHLFRFPGRRPGRALRGVLGRSGPDEAPEEVPSVVSLPRAG